MIPRRFFILAVLILLPQLAPAQFQSGLRVGYCFYRFTSPDDGHYMAEYTDYNNSFIVGLYGSIISSPHFSVGAELQYLHQAFAVSSYWGGLGGGSSANLSYDLGNLYIHLKPTIMFGNKVKFYFFPAFYFGTLLHSSLTGTIYKWSMGPGPPPNERTDTISGSAKGYYPQAEFGISPGMGLEVKVGGPFSVIFETTCMLSLTPVGNGWGSSRVKKMNLNVEAGIAYTFGKPLTK